MNRVPSLFLLAQNGEGDAITKSKIVKPLSRENELQPYTFKEKVGVIDIDAKRSADKQ